MKRSRDRYSREKEWNKIMENIGFYVMAIGGFLVLATFTYFLNRAN